MSSAILWINYALGISAMADQDLGDKHFKCGFWIFLFIAFKIN
jgi:hypothetical protein